MYDSITHPITNKTYSIYNKKGIRLIKKYLNNYIKGGSGAHLIAPYVMGKAVEAAATDDQRLGAVAGTVAAGTAVALGIGTAVKKFRDWRNTKADTPVERVAEGETLLESTNITNITNESYKLNKDTKSKVIERWDEGDNLIHVAAKNDQKDTDNINILLQKNPYQIMWKNSDGNTPLHCAIDKLKPENVEKLINFILTQPETQPETISLPVALEEKNNKNMNVIEYFYAIKSQYNYKDSDNKDIIEKIEKIKELIQKYTPPYFKEDIFYDLSNTGFKLHWKSHHTYIDPIYLCHRGVTLPCIANEGYILFIKGYHIKDGYIAEVAPSSSSSPNKERLLTIGEILFIFLTYGHQKELELDLLAVPRTKEKYRYRDHIITVDNINFDKNKGVPIKLKLDSENELNKIKNINIPNSTLEKLKEQIENNEQINLQDNKVENDRRGKIAGTTTLAGVTTLGWLGTAISGPMGLITIGLVLGGLATQYWPHNERHIRVILKISEEVR